MAMTGAPVPRHPSRPLPPHPGAQAAPAQRPDPIAMWCKRSKYGLFASTNLLPPAIR